MPLGIRDYMCVKQPTSECKHLFVISGKWHEQSAVSNAGSLSFLVDLSLIGIVSLVFRDSERVMEV